MTLEFIDVGSDIEGASTSGPVKPLGVVNIAGVGRIQAACIVDALGNVVSSFAAEKPSTPVAGRLSVGVAASRITATPTTIKRLDMCAPISNSGTIYVGGATVSGGSGTETGFALAAGDKYLIEITDLSAVYFAASAAGQVLTYAYYT